ncbi:hypothetical protein DS2_15979 [Catenovulum agarivorans DS-2]|uniref:MSHA biogenesis protein MshF n=1 Tax=Catenovulum agarivorans DS-2 TaxID=1328313 RepID=W7QKX2_9ALTE|nr:hypothetical protein [Catenovulum agarivorans]EWH08748.1 hypothetical protein DS2_15979 [Catenovulum agarivorans DS-2]
MIGQSQKGFSLAQFMIVLSIMLMLWTIWLVYLKKTDRESNTVAFSMAANQFNEAVHLTHVEWLRQARPDSVNLLSVVETKSLEKRQFPQTQPNSIQMTQKGWPKITSYNAQGCKQLWTDLLDKSTKLITEKQRHYFERIKGRAACVYKYGKKTLLYFEANGEVMSRLTEE